MRTRAGLYLVVAMLAFASACTDTPSPEPSTPIDRATPETTADLVSYILAGTVVDVAAYRGELDSQPTTGVSFLAPGRNIACGFDLTDAFVTCGIQANSWPSIPAPADCDVDWGPNSVTATADGVQRGECRGDPPSYAFATQTLEYGQTISNEKVACRSDPAFLACANLATGNGFVIAPDIYKPIGTVRS